MCEIIAGCEIVDNLVIIVQQLSNLGFPDEITQADDKNNEEVYVFVTHFIVPCLHLEP
jgi:hypothetical protein